MKYEDVDELYKLRGVRRKLKMRHDAYQRVAWGVRMIQETTIPEDSPEWRLKVFWNDTSGEEVLLKHLKCKINILKTDYKILDKKINLLEEE